MKVGITAIVSKLNYNNRVTDDDANKNKKDEDDEKQDYPKKQNKTYKVESDNDVNSFPLRE